MHTTYTITTRETFTSAMKSLSLYQQGEVYHVASRAKCPLWVALDYLIAEEWDEQDALISYRGDSKLNQM